MRISEQFPSHSYSLQVGSAWQGCQGRLWTSGCRALSLWPWIPGCCFPTAGNWSLGTQGSKSLLPSRFHLGVGLSSFKPISEVHLGVTATCSSPPGLEAGQRLWGEVWS